MTASTSPPKSKVARVIEQYNLEGMGAELESAWTGERSERTSLRNLADEFNRAVLDAAVRRSDGILSEIDIQNAYQTLTGDDVPQADRMRKRRELEELGVDVDAVTADFVTHQSIHTYLTEHREAELPDRSKTPDQKAGMLERLRGRTSAVTESTLQELTASGDLTDNPYDVVVNVRVICGNCRTDYAATDLIRQGGCDCNEV